MHRASISQKFMIKAVCSAESTRLICLNQMCIAAQSVSYQLPDIQELQSRSLMYKAKKCHAVSKIHQFSTLLCVSGGLGAPGIGSAEELAAVCLAASSSIEGPVGANCTSVELPRCMGGVALCIMSAG